MKILGCIAIFLCGMAFVKAILYVKDNILSPYINWRRTYRNLIEERTQLLESLRAAYYKADVFKGALTNANAEMLYLKLGMFDAIASALTKEQKEICEQLILTHRKEVDKV